MLVLVFFLIATIGIYSLYLLTMRNLLKAIQPHNRVVHFNDVWLLLIPIFNLVYQFMMVGYVSDSIAAEQRDRDQQEDGPSRPLYELGVWQCSLFIGSVIPIPILKELCSLGGLIVWIIYWVKLSEWKNRFMAGQTKKDESLLDV